MFSRSNSLGKITFNTNKRFSTAVLTKDYPKTTKSAVIFQQQRLLSAWTIPKLLLSSNKNSRRLMLATAGGITLLSSVFGPMVWMTIGGIASIVSWRVMKKTKDKWYEYLNRPEEGGSGIGKTILSQVGAHRAAECVRQTAIDHLKKFKSTAAGQKIFGEFGLLDHDDKLVYDEVVKSESLRLDHDRHKVSVVFWLEDQVSITPKGGSCEVNAEAVIDNHGRIDLTKIKLSSPEWHKDELVPIC